ncbi:hypothetical protein [Jannaschia formosa]|uniref:hypothetical protein n=1 Tax=Jannaschia formosa TaxID=2259592 RepID=UPI000E1C3B03|nr:hypothetical protein [Jannaschia formosa]TFL20065.1 hypothetical protein DR046_01585 [Jannaschia formosa]
MVACDAPPPPPWIAEFDPDRDAIELTCGPGPAPPVALVHSADRTELRLGSDEVARFAPGTRVVLSDILLIRRDDREAGCPRPVAPNTSGGGAADDGAQSPLPRAQTGASHRTGRTP